MFQTFISRHNSNFFSDKLVLTSVTPASSAPVLQTPKDRKSGSAGMPRPISYAVFCLKKKKKGRLEHSPRCHSTQYRCSAHHAVSTTTSSSLCYTWRPAVNV